MQRGLHPHVRGREGSDVRHLEANADLHLQWQWSPFYKGHLESCWTKDTMGSNVLTYIQHPRMISIAAKIPGSWKYPWHFVGRFWQKLLSGPQGTTQLVVLWHSKMCGKVLKKESLLITDGRNSSSWAFEHPLTGKRGTCRGTPAAPSLLGCHASCLCWGAESRAKPWCVLLDAVIWATAEWLVLAYALQLASTCNTLKGTAKQSVLAQLSTKRRWGHWIVQLNCYHELS